MISIVDDDEAVRKATKALVRSSGYCASTFCSAEEFLKSDHLSDTSCLITDLHMPGFGGLELQSQLVSSGHRVPIIFVTGSPGEGARAQAKKAGAVDFLSKPYNETQLIGCLNRALNGPNAGPPSPGRFIDFGLRI